MGPRLANHNKDTKWHDSIPILRSQMAQFSRQFNSIRLPEKFNFMGGANFVHCILSNRIVLYRRLFPSTPVFGDPTRPGQPATFQVAKNANFRFEMGQTNGMFFIEA